MSEVAAASAISWWPGRYFVNDSSVEELIDGKRLEVWTRIGLD